MAVTLFRAIFLFQILSMILCDSSVILKSHSHENENQFTSGINVLAAVLPPFTYFDSNRSFFNGLDIHMLSTIAKRLQLQLNFTRADNLTEIPSSYLK